MRGAGGRRRVHTVAALAVAVAVVTGGCTGGSPNSTPTSTSAPPTSVPRTTTTVGGAAIASEVCSLLDDAEVRVLMGATAAAPGTPAVVTPGTVSSCTWTSRAGGDVAQVRVTVTTGAAARRAFDRIGATANRVRLGTAPAELQIANAAPPASGTGQIDVLLAPRVLLTVTATNRGGVAAARLTSSARAAARRLRVR